MNREDVIAEVRRLAERGHSGSERYCSKPLALEILRLLEGPPPTSRLPGLYRGQRVALKLNDGRKWVVTIEDYNDIGLSSGGMSFPYSSIAYIHTNQNIVKAADAGDWSKV